MQIERDTCSARLYGRAPNQKLFSHLPMKRVSISRPASTRLAIVGLGEMKDRCYYVLALVLLAIPRQIANWRSPPLAIGWQMATKIWGLAKHGEWVGV